MNYAERGYTITAQRKQGIAVYRAKLYLMQRRRRELLATHKDIPPAWDDNTACELIP